jgi:hypothetical protein
MKLFFGTKRPDRPVDTINQAAKAGVGVGRFKIDRCQAEHIKKLEKTVGHDAALAQLLKYLHTSNAK